MAKIKEIEVGVGLSLDKGGAWIKGNTVVRVSMDEHDDPQECLRRAFDIADDSLTERMELYSDATDSETTQSNKKD